MYGSPVGVKRNDATDVKVSTEVTDALSPCAAKDDARERDATDDRDAASSSVAVSVGSKKSVHGVSPSGCSRTSALCCACSSLSSALHVRERRRSRDELRDHASDPLLSRARGTLPALGPNLRGATPVSRKLMSESSECAEAESPSYPLEAPLNERVAAPIRGLPHAVSCCPQALKFGRERPRACAVCSSAAASADKALWVAAENSGAGGMASCARTTASASMGRL